MHTQSWWALKGMERKGLTCRIREARHRSRQLGWLISTFPKKTWLFSGEQQRRWRPRGCLQVWLLYFTSLFWMFNSETGSQWGRCTKKLLIHCTSYRQHRTPLKHLRYLWRITDRFEISMTCLTINMRTSPWLLQLKFQTKSADSGIDSLNGLSKGFNGLQMVSIPKFQKKWSQSMQGNDESSSDFSSKCVSQPYN